MYFFFIYPVWDCRGMKSMDLISLVLEKKSFKYLFRYCLPFSSLSFLIKYFFRSELPSTISCLFFFFSCLFLPSSIKALMRVWRISSDQSLLSELSFSFTLLLIHVLSLKTLPLCFPFLEAISFFILKYIIFKIYICFPRFY